MKVNVMQFGVCVGRHQPSIGTDGRMYIFSHRQKFRDVFAKHCCFIGAFFTLYLNRQITHLRALQQLSTGDARMCRYLTFSFLALTYLAGCSDDDSKQSAVLILNDEPPTESSEPEACEKPESVQCEECPVCELADEETDEQMLDTGDTPAEPLSLNLYSDADNLYAWRKTRASLDPDEDVVFYWSGYVYNVMPKDPEEFRRGGSIDFAEPLFRFEGFNVARFAQDGPSNFTMLSREVSVYQDPRTGAIIDCWTNTLRDDRPELRVMHVANDPVNYGVGTVDFVELGDRVSFFRDILLSYRSPLAGDEDYSEYSASDVYQSNELFNFIVSREDLENEDILSAPVEISWTRVGQYLPWMQMGDTTGHLVYHVRGYKVLGGVESLPPRLLNWTRNQAGEEFLTSPAYIPQSYEPNATTWRVFREAVESGDYRSECQ